MEYHLIIDTYIGDWGCSKNNVQRILSGYKGQHVDVKISSLGGDMAHGLDIRQQFIDHGDVTVYLSGGVASAATIAAMGAKRIVISKYAMYLVHKCLNFIDAWGSYNADQMQTLIDELQANKRENDRLDVMLAQMYAEKCKKSIDEILPILKAGDWMTPAQALELGFVDEISDKFGKNDKINLSPDCKARLNALGLPTDGLARQESIVDRAKRLTTDLFVKKTDGNTSTNDKKAMNTEKLNTVGSLLKVDSFAADDSGNVTLSIDQLRTIENRLCSLESSLSEKISLSENLQKENAELKSQVETLKKAPGDETTEIEDGGGDNKVNAADLFNSIKNVL